MEENEALLKASQNDAESMEWLIIKYKALVCKIARRYFLVSGGGVEDLIQEGTIGLIKAIREYSADNGKTFAAYAYICINNKLKDVVKASYREKNRFLSEALPLPDGEEITEAHGQEADPFTVYIDKEEKENFYQKAKSLLSEKQLSVLRLYLEGYSYKEIAERLRVTAKTVDNALAAAKEKIKKSGNEFIR